MPRRPSRGGACAPPPKPSKRQAATAVGLPGSLIFLIAFALTVLLAYSVVCLMLGQVSLAIIAATAACGLATTAVHRLVMTGRARRRSR